ncbi:MAG: WbqC family protein, partial [Bacteroidota bacterium]|nr:WbqC family protein [Bacteroidota bacterium]
MAAQDIYSITYLPPISWVSSFLKSENPVIDIYEHYIKQTYRNRTDIYSPNGKQTLSIPVIKKYHHTKVKDIEISNVEPWSSIHWKAIRAAYNNSPFFIYYEDELSPVFHKTHSSLLTFVKELLETIFELIGIEKELIFSDHYIEKDDLNRDFRNFFNQKNNTVSVPKYI